MKAAGLYNETFMYMFIPFYIIFGLSLVALILSGRVVGQGIIEDLWQGDWKLAIAGLVVLVIIGVMSCMVYFSFLETINLPKWIS